MDFTTAISFGRFAFLKLTDFTDFCKNSVACETFLWYDNVCKFKELANAQIAQLVEQRTENPRVAGSIPALGIFVAKSNEIIEYGRVAQLVEHLTFNQVVRGSNPRTLIVEQAILLVLFVILTYILITPMLCKRFSTDIICEKV